ncbi:MAG TPA: DUF2769 domain-containing protein [Nanoarchaeota archaeon]|nr:DUF2769 domain-containing protein [Nanoarchaeota archaeon]
MSGEKFDAGMAPKKCICISCPTYKDCGELAFCLSKKEACKAITEEKGCLCQSCPVHEAMSFRHAYYCTSGGEKHQTTKTEKARYARKQ